MSSAIVFKCDLCREDPNPNYFGLSAHVYGIFGVRNSPDSKMQLNTHPTVEDDMNICHGCLTKLMEKFSKLQEENNY